MKRLLILAAVAMLTATSVGCCRWQNRGPSCQSYQPATVPYAAEGCQSPGMGIPQGYVPAPG